MRVRHLASHLLEPGGAGQHDVGEAARRVVQEQVVAHHERRPLQSGCHVGGVGKRRQHVRAHQQQGLGCVLRASAAVTADI